MWLSSAVLHPSHPPAELVSILLPLCWMGVRGEERWHEGPLQQSLTRSKNKPSPVPMASTAPKGRENGTGRCVRAAAHAPSGKSLMGAEKERHVGGEEI